MIDQKEQYLNGSSFFECKQKPISYRELAKKTIPSILAGGAVIGLEAYWPLLVGSQTLPPIGATLLVITGIALILYGVYQGAKYISDMKNEPDCEEDVTPIEPLIKNWWGN